VPESPQFSESSFAFGFVENLLRAGLVKTSAPPVFLSTAVEGKSGGHFDVRIPSAPIAFLMQFKIPAVMKRNSGLATGLALARPYYRMELRAARGYAQHLGLCAWEQQGENVYYVSPRFHSEDDFHRHYRDQKIPTQSAFFRPSAIRLPDHISDHSVVYDRAGVNWETRSSPRTGEGPIDWLLFHETVANAISNAPEISRERFLYSVAEQLAAAVATGHRRADELRNPETRDNYDTEAEHFGSDWRGSLLSVAKEAATIAGVSLGSELVIFGR